MVRSSSRLPVGIQFNPPPAVSPKLYLTPTMQAVVEALPEFRDLVRQQAEDGCQRLFAIGKLVDGDVIYGLAVPIECPIPSPTPPTEAAA